MRHSARQARTIVRNRVRQVRATRRAVKAVATGQPQTARTRLVAGGLDDRIAKAYAGAFSRGVAPIAKETRTIKLRGRVTKDVEVKLYDRATFAARLATYRPGITSVAVQFAAVAA
jgi:hypothetical protein